MSYISSVATDSNGNAVSTGASQELGKDDFLELLVTKLQYQDPLNPMEDEDFIAQLAQFSSLEQLSNIADSMDYSNEIDYLQMQSLNNTMSADFIGKEIKADYSGVYLDDSGDCLISFTTDQYAEEIQFVITDADGNTVTTLDMSDVAAGVNTISWDGKDDLGNRMEAGYYYVEAEASDSSGNTFTPSLSLVGTVASIAYRDGAAYLKVNGMEIALSDVIAIGEPGAFSEEDEG
ncbi:MAG: flagellar hook assembly protein FlgD [Candidatus Zixiibacteriota bacterium]